MLNRRCSPLNENYSNTTPQEKPETVQNISKTRSGVNPRVILPLTIIGIALIVLTVILSMSTTVYGRTFGVLEKDFDLRAAGITSTDELYQLRNPSSIDIRDNDIPAEQIVELISSFPSCDILWSVDINGRTYENTASEVSTKGIRIEDIPLLACFDSLEYIDARGTDAEALAAILQLDLKSRIDWDITVGGTTYTPDTTEIVTGDAADAEIRSLTLLPELKSVDARGCTAYDALLYASEQLPECQFLWTVSINGMDIENTAETINFNRASVTDIEQLDSEFKNLRYLPALKEVDMCGCGVPNEQMAAWRDQYPESKFVWEISFGNKRKSWTVRTDIIVFSSLLSADDETLKLGDEELYRDLFLYCTDLQLLDLGHNKIKDISLITNLKKLQCVILMDNPIKDLSYLAELPDLRYAELNKTKIKDLEFVRSCSKLEHLDVSFITAITDLSPVYESKSIKYLILYGTKVPKADVLAYAESHPDCVVSRFGGYEYQILRCSPLRSGYRYVFTNYKYLESFTDWENFTFTEGAPLTSHPDHRPPEFYTSGRYMAAYERFKALGQF